jgi:hypothetical protein
MRGRARLLAAAMALLLTAGAATRGRACSQCLCGSPTPPGYLLSGLPGRLRYSLEDRYLSKSNTLDDAPGEERQTEHRVSGLVLFRASGRLALQLRVPFALKTNTRAETGAPQAVTHTHGFGDVEVVGRLDAWRFGNPFSRPAAIAVVASGTAPTGSSDMRDAAGERLEAHLQPGSGAWSGMAGLAGDASLLSSAVSASVLGRVNGTNSHGFRYGKALLLNLGYARTLSPTWQAAFELNARDAARDRTEEGTPDPNSGGAVLYASPSVRWSGLGVVALDLLVQIPVAQSLHGVQDEKATGRLSLAWAL